MRRRLRFFFVSTRELNELLNILFFPVNFEKEKMGLLFVKCFRSCMYGSLIECRGNTTKVEGSNGRIQSTLWTICYLSRIVNVGKPSRVSAMNFPLPPLFWRVQDSQSKSDAKAKKNRQRFFACFLSINKSLEVIQPTDFTLQLFLTLYFLEQFAQPTLQ